jgi:hypothetical protein
VFEVWNVDAGECTPRVRERTTELDSLLMIRA